MEDEIIWLSSSENSSDVFESSEEISDTSSEVSNTHRTISIIEKDTISNSNIEKEWLDPSGNQPQIVPFVHRFGLKTFETDYCKAEDFYHLMVTEDLLQQIADQTNIYASHKLHQNKSEGLRHWVPTSKDEIKKMFGLIIWMDILKLPEIGLYWSKHPLFSLNFPHNTMSRNRFKLLLRMVQFSDDKKIGKERIDKIKTTADALNENFKKYYDPPEDVCIDETIISHRGRFSFEEYVKQKKFKNDFIVFKLCSKNGYTHRFQIYDGKISGNAKFSPTDVVMTLSQDIIGKGHTIYVKNWYTSLDLAQQLINKNTHLVGTIRSNCRDLDKEVIEKKLKRGDIFGKEHRTGVTLLKWKDKREILALSTKHSINTVNVKIKGWYCTKPALIVDYNNKKFPMDISDQFNWHYSPLRKTLKWQQKLAFELLLNTAVVNAWILYNGKNNISISFLQYRKNLISYLCHFNNDEITKEDDLSSHTGKHHELLKSTGNPAKRNRCSSCYAECVKKYNSKIARNATKKVTTYCNDCPNKPSLCIPCFNKIHRHIKV